MAKVYDIHSEANFLDFVAKMSHYFTLRGEKDLPFQRLSITCKQWRKPKSSKQHRAYWRCIGELKKAFIANGYDTNEQECHEFAKKKAGFTKMIGDVMVTKSISDASDDATSPEINRLIEVIQRFALEELGTGINIGDDMGGF
jgi:hypothetical protein